MKIDKKKRLQEILDEIKALEPQTRILTADIAHESTCEIFDCNGCFKVEPTKAKVSAYPVEEYNSILKNQYTHYRTVIEEPLTEKQINDCLQFIGMKDE